MVSIAVFVSITLNISVVISVIFALASAVTRASFISKRARWQLSYLINLLAQAW